MSDFYNNFAPFYDAWLSSDQTTQPLLKHYSQAISQQNLDCTIVYLGIATGRMALELAQNSPHHFIGVDNASAMITQSQKRFKEHQRSSQLTCVKQDILQLTISSQKNLFILPLRTLGHFITLDDKRAALLSIYHAMHENEEFLFDMEFFNSEEAHRIHDQYQSAYDNPQTDLVLYNKFSFDFETQIIKVDVQQALLQDSALKGLTLHSYDFSWIYPPELLQLLEEIGFRDITLEQNAYYQLWRMKK